MVSTPGGEPKNAAMQRQGRSLVDAGAHKRSGWTNAQCGFLQFGSRLQKKCGATARPISFSPAGLNFRRFFGRNHSLNPTAMRRFSGLPLTRLTQ
jgi:hypothetical protein